ncbi:MAG: septum formation initiator family protein [Candidatus Firestonebacteria bacterium]|nr:septum formation initiator family protein [Candidatus Firestonebacteria bacterium]
MIGRKISKEKSNQMILYFIVLFLVFVFIAGKDGFISMINFYRKINVLESHIKELEKDNIMLEKEIEKLTKDDEYIEKIAREELSLIKSGEVVYKFVDVPK